MLEPFVDDLSTTGNNKERYPLVTKPAPKSSAGLPPAVDSKAVLTQQPSKAPARVYTETLAGSHEVGAASVAPTDVSFSSNPVEPVASLWSPVSNSATSDPEFPLQVNLGPEPSLSEGLTRPKPKSTPDYKASVLKFANSARAAGSILALAVGDVDCDDFSHRWILGIDQTVCDSSRKRCPCLGLRYRRQIQMAG